MASYPLTTTLVCLLVYWLHKASSRISRAVGETGTAISSRLSALLLFCVDIQLLWNGVAGLVASLPAR